MRYLCWDIDGTLLLTNNAGLDALNLTIRERLGQDYNFTHPLGGTTDSAIVKEVVTKRKRAGDIYGGWKEPEVCFFMTDDPLDVWYPNVAMLYEAYMRRVCGEET